MRNTGLCQRILGMGSDANNIGEKVLLSRAYSLVSQSLVDNFLFKYPTVSKNGRVEAS